MAELSRLISWCQEGNLKELEDFFDNKLARLLNCGTVELDVSGSSAPQVIPYGTLLDRLLNAASACGQVLAFEYIWDSFMRGRRSQIPWESIRGAARRGSVQLAESFHYREPLFWTRKPPQDPRTGIHHGSQIKTALLQGNLPYIDYLLGLGANINDDFPEQSPIRATIRSEADDGEFPYCFQGLRTEINILKNQSWLCSAFAS